MFLYSPLEQFEPIPLLVIFFGNINLSITNITIIFIYIVLVLCYFLNGYIFYINNNKFINLVHPKMGSLRIDGVDFFNYLDHFELNDALYLYFDFYTNKGVSYLTYLADSDELVSKTIENKEYWLNLNLLLLPYLKSEYSREFHRTFFNVLKNKNSDVISINDSFFNNIQLYFSNYLNNLYWVASTLNFNALKSKFSLEDIILYFVKVNKSFTGLSNKRFNRTFTSFINLSVFLRIFGLIYDVALNLVKENIGANRFIKVVRFFPFIFSLFVFILTANLIGLIPYSSTVTSYLIVTFSMAIMVLIGVNVIAGRLHGLLYFGHFLPAGCPFNLYPLIIPIEFISYVFRVVSLSVRLFANMMAGHTLLAVLAGFGWTMANTSVALCFHSPLPILVVFVLVFLETAVAIIQAYVFTILTCMYLDEAINLH
jgi:ATP synthase subunit 6